MKIQYVPIIDIGEAVHRNSRHLEGRYPGISVWQNYEIKDIPESLDFPTTVDGQYFRVKIVEDLLSERFYKVVAADGNAYNPNFTCELCGGERAEEWVRHEKSGAEIPLVIHGKRVCSACFDRADKRITPSGYEFPLHKD